MRRVRRILSVLGPGFITGASDDDPSGIATYSQTGAAFGYSQLWLAPFTFPFMTAIQEMCGRIGMVTGNGLAGVVGKHYGRRILFVAVALLLAANAVNVGADLGAMAASGELLAGGSFGLWLVVVTLVTLLLQIFVPYPTYAKILKYLTLSLFAYVITAFVVKQDWSKVAVSALIPAISFSKAYVLNVVAILGTTISPYLFFWEADEEVQEEIEHHQLSAFGAGTPAIGPSDIRRMRLDTLVGMFFSQLVMFFIIITAASTLAPHGITQIDTAPQAAQALRPLAGNLAYWLFAAGIIGTGMLAVPVLSGSAAYAVSETVGWEAGLDRTFTQARRFYGLIIAVTLLGVLVNFLPIPPFRLLYYTAILNGLCAPPLMVLILLIGNNREIMGGYTNSRLSNALGWIITAIMTVAGLAVLYSLVHG